MRACVRALWELRALVDGVANLCGVELGVRRSCSCDLELGTGSISGLSVRIRSLSCVCACEGDWFVMTWMHSNLILELLNLCLHSRFEGI